VQLHRNNHFYDFLLKVCELIYRNLLVSEKSGVCKFVNFVQDREQMAGVFEEFVRSFYRIHTNFLVKREDIYWKWRAVDAISGGLLPKMRTDISLISSTRRIIIDCKYTPEATQHYYESEKLRSQHLYQLNAYMNNIEGEWAESCEMMLLYPTVETSFRASFTHGRHKISIRCINLNQAWKNIHTDLLAILE
jgi:5-methylcytosine-specific restriction enzyme subunit McrC